MKKLDKIQVPYFGFDFVYYGVTPMDKSRVLFSIVKPFVPSINYPSFYTYFENIVKERGGNNFDIDSYTNKLFFELPKKDAETKINIISEKFNILLGLFNKDNVFSNAENIKDAEVIYFFWQFKIGLYKSNISDAYILYLNSPLFDNTKLSETLREFIQKGIFSINSVQTKHLGNNESWVVFQFDPLTNLSKNDLVDFIWWLQDKYERYSKPFALNIQQTQNLQPYYLLPKSKVQIYSVEKTPYFTFTPPNTNPILKEAIEQFAKNSLPLNDFPSFISNQDNSWTFTMGNISFAKEKEYYEKLDMVLDFFASNQPTATTFPPEFFAVENDNSFEFQEFIKWFSKKYNNNYSGTSLWYGFDETETQRVVSDLQKFKGNPQVFTAKEFMDNLRGSQMPTQAQPIPTKKVTSSNDYSQKIEQLKKEIAEGMFLKSIISPIEFEKRIEIEQSIGKKQKEINELNFKTFEEKFEGSGVFDELFEQSFITLQHEYTNVYSTSTNENVADYFTPNGKASNYSDEVNELIRTPQFKEWFGDWELSYFYKDIEGVKLDCSKVLNENYEPLIVWHGTGREFSYFKYDTFPASYFAVNKDYAKWFADLHGGDDGYVLPFFLNIKNPLDLTHFGTRKISTKDFFDYMYLQTGLDIEGLEVNPIFADSSFRPVETWVYIRNNPKMLKKISELQIFDGIHFYETNPSVPTGEKAHETEVWITFKPDQAKLADPSRGTILMASLKSFILKRGGKI
jgi:hypothetical protein